MPRWLALALCMVCASCRTAPSAPAARRADPADSVVMVEVVRPRSDEHRPNQAAGFVRSDGYVVTTLGTLQGADHVSVRTNSGDVYPSRGIVSWHSEASVGLLEVDWPSERPPGLAVAPWVIPGTPLTFTPLPRPPDSAPAPLVMTAPTDPDRVIFKVWPSDPNVMAELVRTVGIVVTDSTGQAVGLVNGAFMGMKMVPSPGLPYAFLECTRPEIVGALQPGPAQEWERWSQGQADRERAKSLTAQAGDALKKDQNEKAITLAREATEKDPCSWLAWKELAIGLYRSDKWQDAHDAYFRAEVLTPTDGESIAWRSMSLAHLGRIDDAVRASARAVAVDRDDPSTWDIRGWVLRKAGRSEEAVAAYKEALRLDPESSSAIAALHDLEREAPPADESSNPGRQ